MAMASTNCWKCLLRPSVSPAASILANAPRLAAFSISSPDFAVIPKKKGTPAKPVKGTNTLRIKKKTITKTGRPPAPGERKAMRKRIILSNPNAIEVPGLKEMTAETLMDPSMIGKVATIPGPVVDQLRAVEAFKVPQGWGLFRAPSTLIREESRALTEKLLGAGEAKKTIVTILDGARGTGKSMMLLQAMAAAFTDGWVVISIPEAQELTTAATAYSPLPGADPVLYTQNTYTAAWLAQIAKANQGELSKFVVSKDYNLPVSLPSDATLARLAELGARDPETSWQFFQALWNELTLPGRPPILFTLDGLNHIMKLSDYRNKDFELIHSHELAIVKLFVDYLSGAKTFPNGGALLTATTKGNAPPVSYAMKLALQQQEEKAAGQELTRLDPWTKLDKRSYDSLQKAEVLKLDGLTKPEARGLMEYWAASGVLRAAVTEKMVAEKWTLAGHGVIGEIERGALRMRI